MFILIFIFYVLYSISISISIYIYIVVPVLPAMPPPVLGLFERIFMIPIRVGDVWMFGIC